MWDKLRELKEKSDLPWTIVGDFNEAVWQFEHFSLTPRAERQMESFREALDDCALTDLGFSGVPFTYDNKRAVRLQAEQLKQNKRRCRQYELFWERASDLPEVIEQAWAAAGDKSDMEAIQSCLGNVMKSLQNWSSRKFGNILKHLQEVRTELEGMLNSGADSTEVRRVSDKLNELLYKEEMLWLQRSRINWLREGDRNTKFFHRKAIWRAKKNKISKLQANGNWIFSSAELESMATAYFQNLFTRDPNLNPEEIVALFESKVSVEMNERLCKEFTASEISDALFEIGPLKAPGIDGFPARFYQWNWGIMKEEVILAVKLFFATGEMPANINHTAVVLIPKVDVPTTLRDFRPISLCTVLYKVIAKCLANRLRPMLGEIISINQSAFVPGRLITDNALVAFECFHFIEQNKNPEKNFCAYKIDLSKAYDRVDWGFLENAMKGLGFDYRWIKWIMSCVTSAEVDQAVRVQQVINSYAQGTGQLVNFDKCSLMFGKSCPVDTQEGIKTLLQAWRLIENPQSLCAQVLKAKYYPNGFLVDTVFTDNASSTWQAVEYGLELLKKGIIWRIGNGSQIKASSRLDSDFLAWHPDKRGCFSVRSAYYLSLQEQMAKQDNGASSGQPDGRRSVWNLIWKNGAPAKAKEDVHHARRMCTMLLSYVLMQRCFGRL
ncbi:uncharacterized protein [Aegilops tauschii subsp. strangulata]|uniref:uncharacterized protein n=1 Tax=Aegilops tauschii subsp. strangulata TaxID=200361 RepID=UPI003CC8BC22